jgi:hypothetical protein
MSECPHKQLKKQMVGEFVYFACECGQKFRVEPWDGRVSVVATARATSEPGAGSELEELRAWKQSAIAVMPDYQKIGNLLGVGLGESVHDKIIPALERLLALQQATPPPVTRRKVGEHR